MIVSKSELAAELRLSRGRISQLLKAGMPARTDGRLDRETCVAWIRDHVYRRPSLSDPVAINLPATNQAGGGPDLTPARSDAAPAAGSLVDIRMAREAQKLERERLEFQKMRADLTPVADVRAATMARATAEREALLNWPCRAAPGIAACLGLKERDVFRVIDEEVRKFLEERSRTPVPQTEEIDDAG